MKIGMTQNISPSFTPSHSTSSGDASPTTVRSASRKVGRLRRADMAANWSDITTRKHFFSGGPPPMRSSRAVIFQTLAIRPICSLRNVRQAEIRCHNQRSPYPSLLASLDLRALCRMGGSWSSRTCSLAPDKLSNASIYDLCGQLNHPGQRCSLGDLFDQRDCQCEQWVSLAFLEGNLVDPSLIVRESVADLADSVFEPVDRISQLQFLSH